jgi:hypothetical protein
MTGKIEKVRTVLSNPYLHIESVLDQYIKDILDKKVGVQKRVDMATIFTDEWKRLPIKYNKLFNEKQDYKCDGDGDVKGFCVTSMKHSDQKHYLVNVFTIINKLLSVTNKFDGSILNKLVKNAINQDIKYKLDTVIQDLNDSNPCFKHLFKGKQDDKTLVENIFSVIDDENYHPSEYELRLLAEYLDIKIYVLGRRTLRNPSETQCFKPSKTCKRFVILLQNPQKISPADGIKIPYDKYELVVKGKNKRQFLFNDDDIPHLKQFFHEICTKQYIFVST